MPHRFCGAAQARDAPQSRGPGSGRSPCRPTAGGFSLCGSRKCVTPWVTWGDIATDGFSMGSRKSCGWGMAWCSEQESTSERVWRRCPSRAPIAQGGKMPGGMPSQAGAGRPGFLSGELRTHWHACSLAAGRQPLPATPSLHSPRQPCASPRVGGIPLGSLQWKVAGLHVSEFCLLYWAGLAFICLTSLETLRGELASSTHTLFAAEQGLDVSHLLGRIQPLCKLCCILHA